MTRPRSDQPLAAARRAARASEPAVQPRGRVDGAPTTPTPTQPIRRRLDLDGPLRTRTPPATAAGPSPHRAGPSRTARTGRRRPRIPARSSRGAAARAARPAGRFGTGGPPPRPMPSRPTTAAPRSRGGSGRPSACLALVVGCSAASSAALGYDRWRRQRHRTTTASTACGRRTPPRSRPTTARSPAVAQALLPSTVQIVAAVRRRGRAAPPAPGFVLDREGHVVTNNHVVASAAEDDGPIIVDRPRGRAPRGDGRRSQLGLRPRRAGRSRAPTSLEPAALGASLGAARRRPRGRLRRPARPEPDRHVGHRQRPQPAGDHVGASPTTTRPTSTPCRPTPRSTPATPVARSSTSPARSSGVNSAIATTGGCLGGECGQHRRRLRHPDRAGPHDGRPDPAHRQGGVPRHRRPGAHRRRARRRRSARSPRSCADTPAERAGLQKDDVITAVDDQPVTDGIALIVAIRTHLPGDDRRDVGGARRRGADRRGHARRRGRLSQLRAPSVGDRRRVHERVLGRRTCVVSAYIRWMNSSSCAPLDAPLAPSADLDRGQVAASHQRVDLRAGGVEHLGDVGERQEAGVVGHGAIVPPTRPAPVAAGVLWRDRCESGLWTTMASCSDHRTSRAAPRRPVAVSDPRRPPTCPPPPGATPPGWRDPRLWVGVALVTGSVVAGRAHPGRCRRHDRRVGRLVRPGGRADRSPPTTSRPPGCASTTAPTSTATSASTSSCPTSAHPRAAAVGRASWCRPPRWGSRRRTTP